MFLQLGARAGAGGGDMGQERIEILRRKASDCKRTRSLSWKKWMARSSARSFT